MLKYEFQVEQTRRSLLRVRSDSQYGTSSIHSLDVSVWNVIGDEDVDEDLEDNEHVDGEDSEVADVSGVAGDDERGIDWELLESSSELEEEVLSEFEIDGLSL